jgi:hypothetical protein
MKPARKEPVAGLRSRSLLSCLPIGPLPWRHVADRTATLAPRVARGIRLESMGAKLEFTDDELRALTLSLEEQRHGLMIELTGADARDFKDKLRARLEKVETLTARLESSVGHAPLS